MLCVKYREVGLRKFFGEKYFCSECWGYVGWSLKEIVRGVRKSGRRRGPMCPGGVVGQSCVLFGDGKNRCAAPVELPTKFSVVAKFHRRRITYRILTGNLRGAAGFDSPLAFGRR